MMNDLTEAISGLDKKVSMVALFTAAAKVAMVARRTPGSASPLIPDFAMNPAILSGVDPMT
jgi:hypothetical protein